MGGYCIEGGDISEAELAEGVLEDRDSGFGGGRGVGGGVDGFNDFVYLRGNKGVLDVD